MADTPASPSGKPINKSSLSDKRKITVNELIEATNQGIAAAEQTSRSAEGLSTKNSSVLAGTIGSTVGLGLAVGVAVKLASVPVFLALGPIGVAGGLATGIMIFRGKKTIQEDRAEENRRRSAKSIQDDIANLPANAPDDLRERMWKEYEKARFGHSTIDISASD